jgi:APA family basic amino acid/polyamine antiporter
MAEEMVFARKASGLVRGLSLYDAFGVGLNTVQPIWSIWYLFLIGLGLFSGANLIISIAIAGVMVGVCGPLVWGILGGSMPRSGGEYIYNSRVLNPVIGLAASFAQVIAVVYWSFIMTTWISIPSLSMLAEYMGWDGMREFVNGRYGIFAIAIVADLLVFAMLAFGMKVFRRIQKPVVVIGVLGPIVLAIALTFASKADFISDWNALAAQYGSLDYDSFIKAAGTAAGEPMPTTWNWGDTFGAISGAFALFIYTYVVAYVGGEVKRPTRTIMLANYAVIWIAVGVAIWTVWAFYRLVDFEFLSAAAFNDLNMSVEGYTFPYSSSYFTLSWIAGGQSWVVAVAASLTFLLTSLLGMAVNLMVVSRAAFAWGMDRVGPRWFTDVNPRFASPIKAYAFFTAVIIAGTIVYNLVLTNQLAGLTAAGMQLVSVFLITGLSAILLPYRARVRGVWEASPYSAWKLLGVPVVTIAGLVYVAFIGILMYFAFIDSTTRDITGKNLIVFAAAWAIGVIWFMVFRARSRREGIDLDVTYGELPPE